MNRFFKNKCLAASILVHVLVVVAVLFGPAFHRDEPKEKFKPLKVISSKVMDRALAASTPKNVEEPNPVRKPEPAPRQRTQSRPRTQNRPAKPVVSNPKPKTKPSPPPKQAVSQKPTVQISQKFVSGAVQTSSRRSNPKPDYSRQRQQLDNTLNRLANQMSPSTDISISGDNKAAFSSYAALVKRKYEAAWVEPSELEVSNPTVQVEVVILQSGKVDSARVIRRSGAAPMDQSIEKVLKSIDFIAPFPENIRESKKTFHINFNLKAKQGFG